MARQWRRYALPAIIIVGLSLRLAIAWTDTPALVSKALPDDAFYYFMIVEKALAGEGVTFDGLAPTNGFHPLWALFLAPIMALSPTRDAGLHVALTLSALFDAGTIYLAHRAARRLTGDWRAGLWAAGLYAFNPRLILESVNGLETAASTFCFALLAAYYLRLRQAEQPRGGVWAYALLGALAGLAVWGRTDALLIVAVLGLDILARRRAGAFVPLALMGGAALLVLSPWVIWNQVTFGTPLQSSGVAVPYLVRSYLFERSSATGLLRIIGPYLYLATLLLQMLFEYANLSLAIVIAVGLWRLVRREAKGVTGAARAWLWPLAGAGLLLLVHAFGRFFLRGWYFVPLVFALSVWAGAILAPLAAGRRAVQVGAAVAIGVVLIVGGGLLWQGGVYPWQATMLEAAQWAGQETESDATLGAFNAGILGWFSDRRTLNLDGVVSAPAFDAIRRGELLGFMRQHGVDYLIDMQSSVEETYAPFFEPAYREALQPVRSFETLAGGGVWDVLIAYRLLEP